MDKLAEQLQQLEHALGESLPQQQQQQQGKCLNLEIRDYEQCRAPPRFLSRIPRWVQHAKPWLMNGEFRTDSIYAMLASVQSVSSEKSRLNEVE